jgi:hypothetical protein
MHEPVIAEAARSSENTQKEIPPSVGCLLNIYAVGILLALPFLLINLTISRFDYEFYELDVDRIELILIGLLSVGHVVIFFLPFFIAKIFKERRFDVNIRFGIGTYMVLLWLSNIIVWLSLWGFFSLGNSG